MDDQNRGQDEEEGGGHNQSETSAPRQDREKVRRVEFEERAFSLLVDFEGLWMGPQTPGTAQRGAPDAPKDCQRDHVIRP